jgi:hypothetical protein
MQDPTVCEGGTENDLAEYMLVLKVISHFPRFIQKRWDELNVKYALYTMLVLFGTKCHWNQARSFGKPRRHNC